MQLFYYIYTNLYTMKTLITIFLMATICHMGYAADTPGFSEFGFITGNRYIVLTEYQDSTWEKDAPYSSDGDASGAYITLCNTQLTALPAEYAHLLNQKVRIYTSEGFYITKVTALKLYGVIRPGMGEPFEWSQLPSEKAKSKEIFNRSLKYLVAEFEPNTAETLYFATPVSKPSPKVLEPTSEEATDAYLEKVTALLPATKSYRDAQASYEEDNGKDAGKWWVDESSAEAFASFGNYATLAHIAGNSCSQQFSAERFSIWKLEGNKPVLQFIQEAYYDTVLAVDVDNDNVPEFILDDGTGKFIILKKIDGTWQAWHSWRILDTSCGC
jgi:hypothetical protein